MNESKFLSPNSKAPVVDYGEGVYVYDKEGRKYLDGSSGAMTVSLGHTNQEIVEAMTKQLHKITFSYRNQFTNEALEKLCGRLDELAPGKSNKVSFANSGSEATELALKAAYSYWCAKGQPTKQYIISRWSSYHGSTIGSLSMTGNVARRKEYAPYLEYYPLIELPICRHCPYGKTYPGCELFCANYLQKIITRMGKENISAVIVEPITGASGAGITPPDDYFPRIQRICADNDILLIFDEVITGIGRTGKFFACEHWNISPDIICFGKGISSGYAPLSGVIVNEKMSIAFEEKGIIFSTGHTFSGNPLSAATANAILDYMEKYNIVEKVKEKGELFETKLLDLKKRYSFISEIRGKGLLWGIELSDTNKFFDPELNITARLVGLCFNNGLIVYPSTGYIDGVLGDSILLSPPFIISEEEIDELFSILDKSLSELLQA